MDDSLQFYFYPHYKGHVGKLPVFMYPGPQYQVWQVNEYDMTAFPSVGQPGKYIIRTWVENGQQREEATVWTEEAQRNIHNQLQELFSQYREKFNRFMETIDMSEITPLDREAAAFVDEYRLNRFSV